MKTLTVALLLFSSGSLAYSQPKLHERLTPYPELARSYADGRMTLGFRLLNNVKRHLERLDALAHRFRLSKEEEAALQIARTFFGSLDLSDLRTSVVVAQIDLERSQIYVKNAKDVLASMDRPGGISKETVQLTARIVDSIVRRTGAFDQEISNRSTLVSKFEVIRDATPDPFVLTSSLEAATTSFLEALVQNQSHFEELRRADSASYVTVSRWLAAARKASAELQKQSLHGDMTLPRSLPTDDFRYEPTPWVVGKIKYKDIPDGSGISAVVNQLNSSPVLIGAAPASIQGVDLRSVTSEPYLASYEEALELRGKYFKGYKLGETRAETKYVSLAGFPLIVSAARGPQIGGQWQSMKEPLSTSRAKFFSVVDFATTQAVSGAVALDTLFVLLTKP
jgi:hypothetical protein